jgi:hypothetical protein
MIRFSDTITISRAPAVVFAYLADFENVPRWNYATASTRRLNSGPVADHGDRVHAQDVPHGGGMLVHQCRRHWHSQRCRQPRGPELVHQPGQPPPRPPLGPSLHHHGQHGYRTLPREL